jgi:hypothetical protein
MIAYNALLKHNQYGQVKEFILVKESSFSWSVFFCGVFWFLYQKMWQESLLYLVNILIIIVFCKLFHIDYFYLLAIFHIMVSLNANNWKCVYLQNKLHYNYVGLFFAKNEFLALQMVIKNNIKTSKHLDFSFMKSHNSQKIKFFNKK